MRTVVVMPAWNEAEGIAEFLDELNVALAQWNPEFIVVDDYSTDGTAEAARRVARSGARVDVVTNESNLGHGPSTLRALALGLARGADLVVSIDGDGQFIGEDVGKLLTAFESSTALVAEGVRTDRSDPRYRRFASFGTQVLVWAKSHKWPVDANTPLRAYRREALRRLLCTIPNSSPTPNLHMSVATRRGIPMIQVPVRSIPRRGARSSGTTWGVTTDSVPNRRFISFCVSAIKEWHRSYRMPSVPATILQAPDRGSDDAQEQPNSCAPHRQ